MARGMNAPGDNSSYPSTTESHRSGSRARNLGGVQVVGKYLGACGLNESLKNILLKLGTFQVRVPHGDRTTRQFQAAGPSIGSDSRIRVEDARRLRNERSFFEWSSVAGRPDGGHPEPVSPAAFGGRKRAPSLRNHLARERPGGNQISRQRRDWSSPRLTHPLPRSRAAVLRAHCPSPNFPDS